MNLLEIVLLNFIYLCFPLVFYLLYQVHSKTLVKEKNELYLDIALITSFYFIKQYGMLEFNFISLLIMNIPLVIAYIKKRKLSIILLSIISIIYYYQNLNFSLVLLIIEYFTYFIMYMYFDRKKEENNNLLYVLVFIKCLMIIIQLLLLAILNPNNLLSLIIAIGIFFIEIFIVIYLFKKSEDILKLYKTIKELQEEKQVRESLFKITHEIKNPIAVCKGYLDMFDVNKVEHSRKYVPIIKSEIDRVLVLLQDFLSITKIKIEPDIIDINLLLEDVLESFLPLINDRKIKIKSHFEQEEMYISADYNRLSQVFVNIIKNSIEALESVDNAQIDIYVKSNKNSVVIEIHDNGIGITDENLKRMNEPFFTTKSNGTGLGVYLSTEIVKAHSGTIRYKCEKGKTVATVNLPNKKGY